MNVIEIRKLFRISGVSGVILIIIFGITDRLMRKQDVFCQVFMQLYDTKFCQNLYSITELRHVDR